MKIDIDDLWHQYPSGTMALRGISLQIHDARPTAIVGQNGAGKTTLVRHLNRLLLPTRGDVRLDGVSTRVKSVAQWSRSVGYVFQNADDQLFLTSVRRELSFGPERMGWAKDRIGQAVEEAAELVGISDLLSSHPHDLPPMQRKLIAIGAVVAMDPEVIILDEPTTGQDPRGVSIISSVVNRLAAKGKQVLTISHDMAFVAQSFERVIVLAEGQVLLDGEVRDVFSRPDILARSWVTPPPATRVAQRLGLPAKVISVEECVQAIISAATGSYKVVQ